MPIPAVSTHVKTYWSTRPGHPPTATHHTSSAFQPTVSFLHEPYISPAPKQEKLTNPIRRGKSHRWFLQRISSLASK